MLVSDSIAAICSAAMFLLSIRSELQIWNIYLVNFIIGFDGIVELFFSINL